MTDETTRNAAAFYGNAAKARAPAPCCGAAARGPLLRSMGR
jgi:hypothetical protein